MCQPGHLTRPLEPYVRELLRKGTRNNSSPGTKRRDPPLFIANVTICAQLNELSAKYDERSNSLSPSQVNSEWLGPAYATHTMRGRPPHGL